jgi:hypothetical protein
MSFKDVKVAEFFHEADMRLNDIVGENNGSLWIIRFQIKMALSGVKKTSA